jgi:hypothetical protein
MKATARSDSMTLIDIREKSMARAMLQARRIAQMFFL